MSAELPSTEQIFTETSRLVPLFTWYPLWILFQGLLYIENQRALWAISCNRPAIYHSGLFYPKLFCIKKVKQLDLVAPLDDKKSDYFLSISYWNWGIYELFSLAGKV